MAQNANTLSATITSARPARCMRFAPSITFINLSTPSHRLSRTSVADLALRIPGELNVGSGHRLLARQVNGRLVLFHIKTPIHLQIGPDALDHLDPYVIQRRS